jgi:transcriptional antiterminator NusG
MGDSRLYAYCIFCMTGQEHNIANILNKQYLNIEALVPVRVLQEKRGGKWESRKRVMIPGYIFVFSEEKVSFSRIQAHSGFYKVLRYPNGERELVGFDYEYAMWLYNCDGKLETSTVLTEGAKVKVIDGPLASGIGKIIKLDRHKRRAMVEFQFHGNTQKVSLSVVDLTSLEN